MQKGPRKRHMSTSATRIRFFHLLCDFLRVDASCFSPVQGPLSVHGEAASAGWTSEQPVSQSCLQTAVPSTVYCLISLCKLCKS